MMRNPVKLSHEAVVRLLSFCITVGLICYFLPTDDRTRFSYEINRPWGYSLLTAPFDIPVRLDSISAARIKDSIDTKFEPVYHRVDTLGPNMLTTYAKRLMATPDIKLSHVQKNALLNEIKNLYASGIVDLATYAEISSGRLNNVRMLSNNVTVSVPTSGFRSARSAYAHLDSVFRNPDIHSAITVTRLSEYLQPNIVADSIETERFRNELYQSALAPVGVIQQGEIGRAHV